ncbi:SDR family NAD(P)-dependent oxidoreductase [Bradyrhizobium sp. CB1717]|uniref:SDR family NAD(P)-dependent oxidoreductase n=1 Tax=Bradyrhizobium sp. CB1717 TaxID=3039154 RepID=UPI0024B05FBB|nr:SDR family NAD(P)-dependent oxidoreductase [Bradyrhizobium sp. CB1717]WFU27534.1 SDR family NAD(P)-dependent oxidoreductase [Bradyrhizobium sp. CB1717]
MMASQGKVAGLLHDRLVVVTGAGQGIGRAIALGVAAAGARVVLTDLRQDRAESAAREIRDGGKEAVAYSLDVTDAEACRDVAKRVDEEIGPADVIVNNAGIIIRESIDSERAHENWRQVFDVNVNGTFNVVHAFIPALRKTHGSIINVASVAAFGGMNGALGYSPSKGAVRLFTQALARDLAPDGIRVNAVAPGIIATEMSESTRDNPARLSGLMARTPMKRVGQPDEIAGPVIFLASAMASYVNGVILPVDGGYLA